MSRSFWRGAVAGALLMFSASAAAQGPGPVYQDAFGNWVDPATNRAFDNYVDAEALNLQSISGDYLQQHFFYEQLIWLAVLDQEIKRRVGQQKMQAGRATTRFRPASGPPAVEHLPATLKDPKQREQLGRGLAGLLKGFRNEGATRGRAPAADDCAEIFGLAFVLNYEALTGGQQPGPERYRRITEEFRRSLLADPVFQGTDDKDKQVQAERTAIAAVLALARFRRANKANDALELRRAREAAAKNLKPLWDKPPTGLELTAVGFADRGSRLLEERKTTTSYRPMPEPLVPAQLAAGGATPEAVRHATADLKAFAEETRRIGASANDLGHCAALSVKMNYFVHSGGTDLTDRQYRSLVKLLSKDFLENLDWVGLPDLPRQQACEEFAIEAVQTLREYRHAVEVEIPKRKAEAMRQYPNSPHYQNLWLRARPPDAPPRAKAKRQLLALFAPLRFDDYRLTGDGFVPAPTR